MRTCNNTSYRSGEVSWGVATGISATKLLTWDGCRDVACYVSTGLGPIDNDFETALLAWTRSAKTQRVAFVGVRGLGERGAQSLPRFGPCNTVCTELGRKPDNPTL